MTDMTSWEEEKFDEVFDDEIRVLTRRIKHDADCTIEDLQGTLNSLYIIEGNNIEGRGRAAEISLAASIAAYEKFIDDLKRGALL